MHVDSEYKQETNNRLNKTLRVRVSFNICNESQIKLCSIHSCLDIQSTGTQFLWSQFLKAGSKFIGSEM